jgi:TRAP-type C4-dicarboxylate transport system permease small subunit
MAAMQTLALSPPLLIKVFGFLDCVYKWCGYAAGACVVLIFLLTLLQVVGRFLGYNPAGLSDYVGYLTAATIFLALPHGFNRGSHVRVSLLVSMLGAARRWVELGVFAFCGAVAAWFAYFSWSMVIWSYWLGDMSSGLDATRLWIPQLSMALGAALLAVAVIDHGLRLALLGDHGIKDGEMPA